ncbi:hypothetical protein [Actinoallomurus sp. CA-142502]|uniref:hypothetical protein n=1 Tax=Actinoallomurus sp. CA-142502 TaxID=3239885 RepID=UPI003D931A77
MSDTLFDVDPTQVGTPEPTEKLSADRRRTLRQADALTRRRHPLELALGFPLGLHPAAAADDRTAPGLRCGTCGFRQVLTHNDGRFPKCLFAVTDKTAPRVTRGAGTDVRAWWPACRDYQAAEEAPTS